MIGVCFLGTHGSEKRTVLRAQYDRVRSLFGIPDNSRVLVILVPT